VFHAPAMCTGPCPAENNNLAWATFSNFCFHRFWHKTTSLGRDRASGGFLGMMIQSSADTQCPGQLTENAGIGNGNGKRNAGTRKRLVPEEY
jgi:hypothetical protein